MDLNQLKSRGGVYTAPPVPKEIVWTHADPETGEDVTDTFTIHVRRLPYGDVERMIKALQEGRSQTAEMISAAVRLGENGKETIDYDTALLLDPALAGLFAKAVEEVNTRQKKASTTETDSGTS